MVAIAGHSGYIGKIVINDLVNKGIRFYKIPSFRDLSSEEIDKDTPAGKVVLINCAGSTLRQDQDRSHDVYVNNLGSIEKLILAYANRLHSLLHMSTTHLNSLEHDNEYTMAKNDCERFLNHSASNFSFQGVSLRLPTIWSNKYLKENSLLDDIVSVDIEKTISLIRSPNAIVHIASENSIGIQVGHFLKGQINELGYSELNSWKGKVSQLIELLKADDVAISSIEKELKLIYKNWQLRKFNL